ncbi:PadR family transcriptional regulator [Microbacterium sp. C7(2022)]|uniref:PadR family transcriptional regulator n=1 Tax=Microbacterium sp. C7(2022) TaxID=2992759 RepID=UPI00237B0EDD|nr:PadR family transcriptional regulator [Microbacterium sp. C7(2022)]MDE0545612.1 PadR family transcriptional regulator [Microbacterium sp. C7(2022)]
MKFENVLLGVLSLKPFHGYELLKWFDAEGQFIRSNTHHSQIYRELSRMVKNGLVEFEVDPREGRPDAKVYRITEHGHRVLLEWIHSPYEPTSRFQDADFNTRFAFSVGLDLGAALRVVETELKYRREQVAISRVRARGLNGADAVEGFDAHAYSRYGEEMHRYGAHAVDQWMEWLEQMRSKLIADITANAGDPTAKELA